MIHGSWKTVTIGATPAVASSEIDLGRQYETVIVVIPTLTTTATLSIQGAMVTGGTPQNIFTTDPATGNNKQVITVTDTVAKTWIAPIGGIQFITLTLSAAQAAAKTFYVCGVRS